MLRRSRRMAILTVAGLLALCAVHPPTAVAAKREEPKDAALRDWWRGPVRYILSKEEIDAFKSLETDEQRQAFINRFWKLRDPTPDTDDNEFRSQFEHRVESANFLFRNETAKPGWLTDRGKIYILLGAPDEIRETPFAGGARQSITWTYQKTDSPYASRNAVILFVEDAGGEFRMDSELSTSLGQSDLARSAVLQDLQKTVSPHVSLYAQAEPLSALDPLHFLVHPDFYMARDGNTFVALTVGMQGAALAERFGNDEPEPPRVVIFGRVAGADGDVYPLQGEQGFVPSAENPLLPADAFFLYQAGLTLPPGDYTAYFGIHDWTTGNIFSFKDDLQVPDFRSGRFAISSVTLAGKLERTAIGSTPERKIPFVLGNLRVLPRPDVLFRNGDELAFYYQVYNARHDVWTDAVDLDATYQFFRRPIGLTDAPFEALGEPLVFENLEEEVLGYSFALDGWPEADYRLRVIVHDNLAGERAQEDAHFRVR